MQKDLLTDAKAAYVAMEDSRYRAEQDLADKYRSFVSEILRLSLAGLAVFSYIYKTGLPPATGFGVTDIVALSGIAMFALRANGGQTTIWNNKRQTTIARVKYWDPQGRVGVLPTEVKTRVNIESRFAVN